MQLGMMVIAVGLSSYNIALFHLVNHAFYKGLLFLGAGAVIHAWADNQDFRKYGGLKAFLPLTYSVMLIASLSLVAFPFMTGFYSKDFILESAYGHFSFSSVAVYFIATIGAMFTTLYSVKVLYLTFLTNPNGPLLNYKKAHEGDIYMTMPLVILAIFSIFFGYLTKDIFIGLGSSFFSDNSLFIHPRHEIMLDTEFAVTSVFKLLPLALTIALSLISLLFSEFLPFALISFKFSRLGYNVFSFFNQRFLIELFYNKYLTGILFKLGGQTTKVLDKGSVELIGPYGLEKVLPNVSRNIAGLDSGVITSYALYILISLLIYILIPYFSLIHSKMFLLIVLALYVSLNRVKHKVFELIKSELTDPLKPNKFTSLPLDSFFGKSLYVIMEKTSFYICKAVNYVLNNKIIIFATLYITWVFRYFPTNILKYFESNEVIDINLIIHLIALCAGICAVILVIVKGCYKGSYEPNLKDFVIAFAKGVFISLIVTATSFYGFTLWVLLFFPDYNGFFKVLAKALYDYLHLERAFQLLFGAWGPWDVRWWTQNPFARYRHGTHVPKGSLAVPGDNIDVDLLEHFINKNMPYLSLYDLMWERDLNPKFLDLNFEGKTPVEKSRIIPGLLEKIEQDKVRTDEEVKELESFLEFVNRAVDGGQLPKQTGYTDTPISFFQGQDLERAKRILSMMNKDEVIFGYHPRNAHDTKLVELGLYGSVRHNYLSEINKQRVKHMDTLKSMIN